MEILSSKIYNLEKKIKKKILEKPCQNRNCVKEITYCNICSSHLFTTDILTGEIIWYTFGKNTFGYSKTTD